MGNKSARAVTAQEKALAHILARQTALTPELFALTSVGHHGVPSNAKVMAYCGLQGMLAVGTASGAVKLYGKDGLEVLLEAPKKRASSSLTIGVVFLKFTASQRLVVSYSDSSIRVFDLSLNGALHAQIPDTWTTSVVTCVETIEFFKFPYILVATDDGDVHVFHEDTGRASTYVISPRDVGITSTEATKHMQYAIAVKANPRDANQVLLAYETSSSVFLWDFAKKKVIREFSVVFKQRLSVSREEDWFNSVQSISWHSSGKRFVAGYKSGGIGILRSDKSNGNYHEFAPREDEVGPVSQIHWLCAPPVSRYSTLPGAILFCGGRSQSESNKLTIICPPQDIGSEDALNELTKSELLTWPVSSFGSLNNAEVSCFTVADSQVDYCSKIAPFSVVILSGNPLDGCQPQISVQCLPGFVRFREGNKEEWEWDFSHLPDPCAIPPNLQASPMKAMSVVNVVGSDGKLQRDLASLAKTGKDDPVVRLVVNGDFEWPLNGGSIVEPMLKGFLPTSAVEEGMQPIIHRESILLSGHENGTVLFWELLPPAEHASKGQMNLLYVLDAASQMDPIPACKAITCMEFCHLSRTLLIGFSGGEVAVFKQSDGHSQPAEANPQCEQEGDAPAEGSSITVKQEEGDGFRMVFCMHTHTSEITKICLSDSIGYAAIADSGGVVSLLHIPTESSKLVIFDVTSDEPNTVESLLLSELVQVIDLAPNPTGSGYTDLSAPAKTPPRDQQESRSSGSFTTQQLAIVPVLFAGRGNGQLEMYHVETGAKMGESLLDIRKASGVSSVVMVNSDGECVSISMKDKSEAVSPEDVKLGDDVDVDRQRFLLCTCGRSIQLIQAVIPKASDMALGSSEMVAQPLACVELRSTILVTAMMRVPIEDRIETCLAVFDQSNHLYIITMMTLEVVYQVECANLGNSMDGIQVHISCCGELIVANTFGEVERYSLFSEHTAKENALLHGKCVKTKLHQFERQYPFDKVPLPSPKKKTIVDAGKMFKKLVTGVKDNVNLDKVFHFSVEEQERKLLMGDRSSSAAAATTEKATGAKAVEGGIQGTKDVLMQTAQVCTTDGNYAISCCFIHLSELEQQLNERGDKLRDLALKTEQMKNTSEDFYNTMKAFNDKNANKKWYEF
ncbi:TPA: hypothetical protein N0F65_006576 [Lagenidium giganteum]|uniref:V-SNARE coiled-coil homology domain-containing protein n=1 Tax=Lagenidium giganteum TaxID=4803 RepID=A0AAV2YBZ4_9STRA|nr:TPA: hypothetical protein N0F65_006576 [Lagenidium giganteum]